MMHPLSLDAAVEAVVPDLGENESKTLGSGGLEGPIPEDPNDPGAAHPFVASFPTTDADGDTVKLMLYQQRMPGRGTSGDFYVTTPTNPIELAAGGEVKIDDAWTLQQFYNQDFAYTFTVVADDGQSVGSVAFTLIDDWEMYLEKADKHLDSWDSQVSAWIGATYQNSMSAYGMLNGFLGEALDGFSTTASTAATVWFTAAGLAAGPEAAAAIALGEIVVTLATQAVINAQESESDGVVAEYQALAAAVRDRDTTWKNEVLNGTSSDPESGEYDKLIQKQTELGSLVGVLSPADLARRAAQYLQDLRQRRPLPLPLPVPAGQIYGQLLLQYAANKGLGVEYQDSSGQWYATTAIFMPYIDAGDIAEELNAKGFVPYE